MRLRESLSAAEWDETISVFGRVAAQAATDKASTERLDKSIIGSA
jgi:hypothetical protein